MESSVPQIAFLQEQSIRAAYFLQMCLIFSVTGFFPYNKAESKTALRGRFAFFFAEGEFIHKAGCITETLAKHEKLNASRASARVFSFGKEYVMYLIICPNQPHQTAPYAQKGALWTITTAPPLP